MRSETLMTKVTQAFIFAAGRGERMRPLTDSIPKPLVKIKGKAIIDYAIEKLNKIPSIEKIIINGFYLNEKIAEHIDILNNPKIIFSREIDKIETGGGLVFAKNLIDLDKPLLTINGDVLWQEKSVVDDIEYLCGNWESKCCDILLGLKKTQDYIGYDGNIYGGGDFMLRGDELFRFSETAMSHVFVGLQIINPKILEQVPAKCFSMSHFYKEAVGEGGLLRRVKGVELKGKYFHIGTVDAVRMVEGLL